MRIMSATLALAVVIALSLGSKSSAADADLTFQNAAQEAQYRTLIDEFRCPKCQNANLSGSDAPIAQDLKHKTYELVKQGQSNEQIRHYMIARYGDFISYKPPMRRSTWVLWFLPPMILLGAFIIGLLRMRERRSLTMIPLSAEETWRLNQLLNRESQTNVKRESGDDR